MKWYEGGVYRDYVEGRPHFWVYDRGKRRVLTDEEVTRLEGYAANTGLQIMTVN
jgi:hypothetical protein